MTTTMTPRMALVVDDSAALRMEMAAICRREGFKVIEACDGESALAAAIANRPDIVCLDLMLPTLSGFEVCARLKSQSETAEVPVLIASARPYPQDRAEATLAGADAYVTKPIDVEEFVSTVRPLVWQNRNRFPA